MRFRNILGNPPFQDLKKRGKTQHKLWIDFTKEVVDNILPEGGRMGWVCPQSFSSPGNKILRYIKKYRPTFISFTTNKSFVDVGQKVGISMCHFYLDKSRLSGSTHIITESGTFDFVFDDSVVYLPNDFCEIAMSIHRKVMWNPKSKLNVGHDYVNCHNVLLKRSDPSVCVISKTKTKRHTFPIVHTNRQIWFSSIRQDFADKKKVMWSRSGETIPFFDDGIHGGTDMCYYILVSDNVEGVNLQNNLRSLLFRYIFQTAKWSGFGNEKVFALLPIIPNKQMNEKEMFDLFGLTDEERKYVRSVCK